MVLQVDGSRLSHPTGVYAAQDAHSDLDEAKGYRPSVLSEGVQKGSMIRRNDSNFS